jgi:crotonobetainyl-CoA hydratase
MSAPDHILVERDGAVLWITIDRPQALNALDPQAHRALSAALDLYAADPALRVAVITGAGERAFCVGSDLKARAAANADDHPPTGFGGISHRFDLMKPVIAAVNGLALGGGVEIVAACDLAIAADHAEFALPEPRVGLAALGGGGLQRLARTLPLKYAMELVLTGRRFGAEEAKRIGLINDVVPRADLKARVRQMAAAIIEGAPLAVEASKQVMLQSLAQPDLVVALRATYPAAERMLASDDAREGQRAFVEKRKPRWQGRKERRSERFLRQGWRRIDLLQDGRRVRRLQLRRHHRRLLAQPHQQVLHGEVELRPAAGARRADDRLHVDRLDACHRPHARRRRRDAGLARL